MICITMCSKETTTNLQLKYLHYGPGHHLGILGARCPEETVQTFVLSWFSVYIKGIYNLVLTESSLEMLISCSRSLFSYFYIKRWSSP